MYELQSSDPKKMKVSERNTKPSSAKLFSRIQRTKSNGENETSGKILKTNEKERKMLGKTTMVAVKNKTKKEKTRDICDSIESVCKNRTSLSDEQVLRDARESKIVDFEDFMCGTRYSLQYRKDCSLAKDVLNNLTEEMSCMKPFQRERMLKSLMVSLNVSVKKMRKFMKDEK
ncbi:unnamed protein product [Caenorhabditis auriculariae]|uniref:Uncharacterized protein n=1 Tax=Caenorhabditis auriculariae TaxID=2777116 RepID=A0A8S1HHL0_9PELO|nr:unnamed protein product [Caenorhabditis auriculariae]